MAAKKTYKIEVTPLDIERAIRNNSYKCVVAQAVQRTVPEATQILVDLQTIRFSLGEHRLQYLTPAPVAQYVVDFDAGDDVHPFEFKLRKPRVTRSQHKRVDPSAPRARAGSPEHHMKRRRRHPTNETLDFVGTNGDVTKEPVLPANRSSPVMGRGRARTFGSRVLRINKERFAAEAASA